MLRASDFVTISAQATIFTPGLQLQTGRVLGRLLDGFGEALDGEPFTIPIPDGFPLAGEAPRLILQNRDGKLRLVASSSRLDITRSGENLDAANPLPRFLEWCLGVFDAYTAATRSRPGRAGCVVTRRAAPEAPAREIAAHFCKPALLDGPLNRPSDFEVHAAKQFALLPKLRINSWFRCKSGILPGSRNAVALVEQDFNTVVEESMPREFSQAELQEFFGRVPEGLQDVLNLYFPEGT
jgi:hypothetical protein